jgi:hypothetical protein
MDAPTQADPPAGPGPYWVKSSQNLPRSAARATEGIEAELPQFLADGRWLLERVGVVVVNRPHRGID